jgi:hypothetical protein
MSCNSSISTCATQGCAGPRLGSAQSPPWSDGASRADTPEDLGLPWMCRYAPVLRPIVSFCARRSSSNLRVVRIRISAASAFEAPVLRLPRVAG